MKIFFAIVITVLLGLPVAALAQLPGGQMTPQQREAALNKAYSDQQEEIVRQERMDQALKDQAALLQKLLDGQKEQLDLQKQEIDMLKQQFNVQRQQLRR